MLTVYDNSEAVSKKIGQDPVKEIDDFFDSHITEILIDETVKRIISHIDKAEFIGNNQIKNRFSDTTDIRNLSTGAKGIISVYAYPRRAFNLSNCQNNAISCIFTLPRGRVIIEIGEHGKHYEDEGEDYFNRVRVVTWEGTRICESVFRVYHYLSWCRVNRNEKDIYFYENECKKRCLTLDDRSEAYVPMGYWQYENEQLIQNLRHRELQELDKIQYPGYNSELPGYMCGGKGIREYTKLEQKIRRKYEKEVTRRERARLGFTGQ